MSLDPPTFLLERTFVDALVSGGPNRDAAVAGYRALLGQFERERVLLVMLSTDLDELQLPTDVRRGLFAPVRTMHVAGQHRIAAAQATCPADMAVPMVMIEWNKLRGIVTFDARWREYDIRVLPRPAVEHHPAS